MNIRARPFRPLLVALAGVYLGSAAGIAWLMLSGWVPHVLTGPVQPVVFGWAATGALFVWLATMPIPSMRVRWPHPRAARDPHPASTAASHQVSRPRW
jgi:hypothetical protein